MPGQVAQNGAMAILNFFTGQVQLYAPSAAPTLATATTGGVLAAGTYQVKTTYVSAFGESAASASASQVTTGTTSTITVTSPAAQAGANAYNVYITAVGGSTWYKQNSTPQAIGTNYVQSAAINTGSNQPPSSFTIATPTLYLALLTGNPATSAAGGTQAVLISDLVEDTTTGYARQSITFSTPSAALPSQVSNTGAITFGPYGANMTVPDQWVALVTVQSGTNGLLLYTWQLDTAEQVLNTQPIVIPAGALILDQG